MQNKIILDTPITLTINTGRLHGEAVVTSTKKIADLKNIFSDENARRQMDQNQLVYEVQAYLPEDEGTTGGLYFGTTIIHPGKVGDEYFMTRGHFHRKIDTGEYYWGIQGQGMLILMDEKRNVWAEKMKPGSLHYIKRAVAHRVANMGMEALVFNACWPSDAGHNYDEIAQNGFAARLVEDNGEAALK